MAVIAEQRAVPATIAALPEGIKRPIRALFEAYCGAHGRVMGALGRQRRHLLICGYPRSGTSLLYNMLGTSLPDFRFTPFERRAVPLLRMAGNIASKTPMDIFEVSQMIERNPWRKQLLVIVPLRDIRDIITSRHPMLPDEYFIGYDYSWWPQPDGTWQYDAPGVGAIQREIEQLKRNDAVKVAMLRYEDLLLDADAIQRDLAAQLGLTFSSPFSSYYEHREGLVYQYKGDHAARDGSMVLEDKPVQKDRAGKWRRPEYRERIRTHFAQFPELFDLLVEAGYEKDRSWYDAYRE